MLGPTRTETLSALFAVHDYVWPSPEPAFLDVYRQYAPTVEQAPEGTPIRRVKV